MIHPRYTDLTKLVDVYTNVQSNSANYNTAYNTATAYSSVSSSFATNTTLNSVSSLLTPLTLTNTLTGLLVTNTIFNNYQTDVANATATLLPKSGGTISGDLTITNNLSVQGAITYLDTTVGVTSALYIDTNSTETALRVTQRGSGDVIRIEDSQNPDSTPFIVNNDGLVGIGTASPNERLTVLVISHLLKQFLLQD